ncbi:MAG: polyribonucleotide nucleotidyltransferase [Candidatus Peregrinibacteria bacterium Greene1014_49]|nr:MAG: polyribonucleotide nucleotidyltransferase [Candidatus Peregrinibacteria bacterium Greene1014_49]
MLGDSPLIVRTGMLANQANASVLCQMGDTVVMGNVTLSAKARAGVDFLPLQVVFQEKFYAGGKIAGSRFRKREGRPSDNFVLMARVVDRGLRPMILKHIRNDIQVFCRSHFRLPLRWANRFGARRIDWRGIGFESQS